MRSFREARAALAFDNLNICAIYEIGEHESQPFAAMQHLGGHTLCERLTTPFPPSTGLR
jgi:hypothetical protein